MSRISGMGLRMSIWESVRSFLGLGGPDKSGPDEMLQMEWNNLKFRFSRIDAIKPASDVETKPYAELERSLEKPASTWDDAYRIEKQIAALLSGDRLRQEIKARLREAVARNARDAAVLQTDYDALLKSIEKEGRTSFDDVLRNFLLEVLENIHWQSKLKHLAREFRLEATRNTLWIVAGALVFVLLPYFPWPSCLRPASSRAYFGLYTALTFGLLGALFSRLITLQTPRSVLTLEELRNALTFRYIFQRACIGACGALIVYFFLQSELVTGTVFPKFEEITKGVVSVSDGKSLAFLIIWSFIAGFSESLVPSVLSNTERQFGGAVSGRPAAPGS